jgi:excisionase family DNA binding protein
MNHALTAQVLFSEMRRMPATERAKFFLLLSTNAFRDDDFSHEQVFGHLAREPLSAAEAAEYLEISLPTLRRYVQAEKLLPSHIVGRKQMFSVNDLRAYKRNRDSNSTELTRRMQGKLARTNNLIKLDFYLCLSDNQRLWKK